MRTTSSVSKELTGGFKKMKNLFAVVIVFFYSFNLYSQSLIEQKLNLEKSIQERTERIVEKIIGSKEMIVLVNVELTKEQSKEKPLYPGMAMSEEEYLPGITYSYVPIDVDNLASVLSIKKISISVTVDKSVSQELVDRIKSEVSTLLGLNPLRGDVVDVQKIAFAFKKLSFREQIANLSSHLFWLFALLLLTIFLFGPLRHFFKTVVKAMELRIEADTRIRGYEEAMRGGTAGPGGMPFMPAGPIELTLERRRPQLGKGEETKVKKKFDFVTADNLKNLIFLLRNEKPEKIAIIINYLPPEFGSEIMGSLSPELQSKVALQLTAPKVIDPEEVNKIEEEIKTKIEYMVGGEDYFLNLLDQVDRETQENILKSLENTNPALATKLRNSLFFFEDIVILDKPILQRVIRETQRQGLSLALALKIVPENVKLKIMDALTEGARAMLVEQIDLLGEVSEKRVQEEQRQIANIVKALEKSGDIVIDRTKRYQILEGSDLAVEPEEVPEEKGKNKNFPK